MSGQAGARWLAHEQIEIAEERAASVILAQEKGGDPIQPAALYPLLDRLDRPSVEALASVCGQSYFEFVRDHGGCECH